MKKKSRKLTTLLAAASTVAVLGGSLATVVGCAKQTDPNDIITIDDTEINKQASFDGQAIYTFGFANEERPDEQTFTRIRIKETKIETKDEKKQKAYLQISKPKSVLVNDKGNFDVIVVFKDPASISNDTKVTFDLEFVYTVNGEAREITKSGLTINYQVPVVKTDTIFAYNKQRTTAAQEETFSFKFVGKDKGFVPATIYVEYIARSGSGTMECEGEATPDHDTGAFSIKIGFSAKPLTVVNNYFDLKLTYIDKAGQEQVILIEGFEYHFVLPQPVEKDTISLIGDDEITVEEGNLSATYEFIYGSVDGSYPTINNVIISSPASDFIEVSNVTAIDAYTGHFQVTIKYKQAPTSYDATIFRLTFKTSSLKFQEIKLDTDLTIIYDAGQVTSSITLLSQKSVAVNTESPFAVYRFCYTGSAESLSATITEQKGDLIFYQQGETITINLHSSKEFYVVIVLNGDLAPKESTSINFQINFTEKGTVQTFTSTTLTFNYTYVDPEHPQIPDVPASYDIADHEYETKIPPELNDSSITTLEAKEMLNKMIAKDLEQNAPMLADQFYLAQNRIYKSLKNKPQTYIATPNRSKFVLPEKQFEHQASYLWLNGATTIEQTFNNNASSTIRTIYDFANLPLAPYYDNGWRLVAAPSLVKLPEWISEDEEVKRQAMLKEVLIKLLEEIKSVSGNQFRFNVIIEEVGTGVKPKSYDLAQPEIIDQYLKDNPGKNIYDVLDLYKAISFDFNVMSTYRLGNILNVEYDKKVVNTKSSTFDFQFKTNIDGGQCDLDIIGNDGDMVLFENGSTHIQLTDLPKAKTIPVPFKLKTDKEEANATFTLRVIDGKGKIYEIPGLQVHYKYEPYIEVLSKKLNHPSWESDILTATYTTNIDVGATPLNVQLTGTTDLNKIKLKDSVISKLEPDGTIALDLAYTDAIIPNERLPISVRIFNEDIGVDETFTYLQEFEGSTGVNEPTTRDYKGKTAQVEFETTYGELSGYKLSAEVMYYQPGKDLMKVAKTMYDGKKIIVIVEVPTSPGTSDPQPFIIRVFGTLGSDKVVRVNYMTSATKPLTLSWKDE